MIRVLSTSSEASGFVSCIYGYGSITQSVTSVEDARAHHLNTVMVGEEIVKARGSTGRCGCGQVNR